MYQKHTHVISHSHWDREWYMPLERHRVRLVELLDTLIELFDNDADFRSFHLDGQTIVLEDYLQIRPEKRERLIQLVQEGKLIIGPWYILQDEFLTSSEANIRNLLIGHRDASQYGAVSKLGYFPDSFGNMGQAPQILRQAGIDTAVFGRGVKPVGFNNEAKGEYESAFSEMYWQSPDGSTVLGILFANWYHNGMEVPSDPTEAAAYWQRTLQNAEKFASTPHLLLMNGCDHQPVQTDLSKALQTARNLYPEVEFIHSNFSEYIRHVKDTLPKQLATIRGELRSQRTDGWWTLVNTASARVYIKQANQRVQTHLEKAAEPLAALAALTGHRYPSHLLTYAWKTLMQNHPHDSICGCSVDEVHREMMVRFDKSIQVSEQIVEDSLQAICSNIDTAAIFSEDDVPFTVFNTSGRQRTGVVSVDLKVKTIPFGKYGREETIELLKSMPIEHFTLKNGSGTLIDAQIEDLGITFGYELPKDRFRQPYMARSVRVRFLAQQVPALGYRTYALCPSASNNSLAMIAEATTAAVTSDDLPRLENEYLVVTIAENGSYDVTDKRTGRTFSGLGVYENSGDIGNEYVFRAPDGDVPLTTSGLTAQIRTVERNGFRHMIEIVHEWHVPSGGDERLEQEIREYVPFLERQAQRSRQTVPLNIITCLTLEHGVPQVNVKTSLVNHVKDHRLRVLFPTDIVSDVHYVDSIFEVAQRQTVPAEEWKNPSYCQHQQAFVNVRNETNGLTVSNLGLNEYEVLRDSRGTIALTLLRAVQELGDWGVFPTPEAQCLGEHEFSYFLIPHGAEEGAIDSYAAAYQAQIPWLTVQTSVQSGDLPAEHRFLGWEGAGLALSTVKLSDSVGAGAGDHLIMRWFNMTDKPTDLQLQPISGTAGSPFKSNVLEEAGENLSFHDNIPVRGAEIVTIGVKRDFKKGK
ncbi:alpha-mannosidase [Paenibacillus thalictri]|uniref:Alpha-mannosidase n=1 Tax=Paenibacillus thalictri TaxID=2527873 RepID=A0A4Q9DX80_9BACL|nr:alpha-mannosidase [Paenibacillus thalictri]TBL80442.1 alpha-mannosidase [Paenibacillus thalictri]